MKQVFLIFAGLFFLGQMTVAQTVWTVNSTDDTNTGSGTTGTLRYVLTQINTTASGTHTIDLTGLSGTITLTSLLPPVNYPVTLNGPGSGILTISGNNLYRIFFIGGGTAPFTSTAPASPTVSIKNLTLANGKGKGGSSTTGGGGAAGMGGAIFMNAGTVTIENVTFSGNTAQGGSSSGTGYGGGGGFGGDGASLYNGGASGYLGGAAGTTTVTAGIGGGGGYRSSTVGGSGGFGGGGGTGGAATTGGGSGSGGFGGGGAGIVNGSNTTAIVGVGGFGGGNAGSVRGGGGAGMGGAIFLKSGTLTVKNSSFLSNVSTAGTAVSPGQPGSAYGGAIFQFDGVLRTLNLVFSGNTAANSPDFYRYGGTASSLNPTVSNPRVTGKTARSVNFTGKVNPNGTATVYKFIYSADSTLAGYSETPLQSAGAGTADQIATGSASLLTPGIRYFYRLVAENSYGTDSSETVSFFTAPAVDGLVLWLRADTLVTRDGSGYVSNWGDLSDARNHFSQASSSKKPLWVEAAVNGKPALRFDGSDDVLGSLHSLNLTSGASIFIVSKVRIRKSNNGLFRVAAGELGVASALELYWEAGTVPTTSGNFTATSNRPATGTSGFTFKRDNDAGPAAGTWYMLTNRYISNGFHDYYMNSKPMEMNYASAGTMQLPASSGSGFIGVGSNSDVGGSAYYLDGDIAEIRVYDRSVTDAEKLLIESQLAVKYGLTGSTSATPTINSYAAESRIFVLGSTGATVNFSDPTNSQGTLTAGTGVNPGITGSLPDGISSFSADKYWTITNSGLTSFIYSITLDLTGITGISDFNSLKILKRADAASAWQDVSQAPINAVVIYQEPFITVSGLTSFSDFAVGSSSANTLPVELAGQSVRETEDGDLLTWETVTEKDNAGFQVQTSPDKQIWKTVGFVAGKGTTTEKTAYTFRVTERNMNTVRFYRLVQIDLDGSQTPGRILSVGGIPAGFRLSGAYPNPFNPSTSIRISIPEKGPVDLTVYSLLGQVVSVSRSGELEAGHHDLQFDGSGLASGVYFYQIRFKNQIKTGRMTLVK